MSNMINNLFSLEKNILRFRPRIFCNSADAQVNTERFHVCRTHAEISCCYFVTGDVNGAEH